MMHLGYMITLLTVAATLGYIVNYSIGRHFGNRIFEAKSRLLRRVFNKTNVISYNTAAKLFFWHVLFLLHVLSHH